LNRAFLLRILFHHDFSLFLKGLVDWQVQFAVSQSFVLLVLGEEVVLDLDKCLVADFFQLSLELVILLLQLLNVLVFDGDGALLVYVLVLLLVQLLLKVGFKFLDLGLLQRQVVLGFLKLGQELLEVGH